MSASVEIGICAKLGEAPPLGIGVLAPAPIAQEAVSGAAIGSGTSTRLRASSWLQTILAMPGVLIFSFISAISFSQVMGCTSGQSLRKPFCTHSGAHFEYQRLRDSGRHCSGGLSFTTVSIIERGAGSVDVSDW